MKSQAETSLYLQIAEEMAEAIKLGSLLAGHKLPSIRKTAGNRGISINTVLAAYRQLEDRGLVEVRPQSGYYVRAKLAEVQKSQMVKSTAVASPKTEVLDLLDIAFAAQQNPAFTNISLACPRGGDFYPAKKLAQILNKLLKDKPNMIESYALPPGSSRLRQQIARRALDMGMRLDADSIILTHGCMEALQLVLRTVTKAGDCVGLESPTYYYLLPLLASLGLKTVEIPTDPQRGISLEAVEMLLLEKKIDVLLVMLSIQNPLGCSMTVPDKKRLADLVNKYQIPLIEDGIYAELFFSGSQPPSVKSFDANGWVIFCTSFTKTLAPDFRVGWMSGGRFNEQLRRIKAVSSMTESAVLTETLAIFLETGGYDHHLRLLRRRYKHQVEEARGLVERYFPDGTKATMPSGGFVFWVELPEQVDSMALFQAALSEQLDFRGAVFPQWTLP